MFLVYNLILTLFLSTIAFSDPIKPNGLISIETDFGRSDGAVAELQFIIHDVDSSLQIHELTHDIPPFDIWSGAYRLRQAAPYAKAGTIFVIVVDPGVGTDRKSIVARTKSGHYFVTPDNGTLTWIDETLEIEEVREIRADLRRPGSEASHTFHGRDIYAYVAALLASEKLTFDSVGPVLDKNALVKLPRQKARIENDVLIGTIEIHDIRYGNIWTNISRELVESFGLQLGANYNIQIKHKGAAVLSRDIPYRKTFGDGKSFGDVATGEPILYFNSLDFFSCAARVASFAKLNNIGFGPDWTLEIRRLP